MVNLTKKETGFYFFLFALAGWVLYAHTLFFDFVWDDHIEVLGNDVFHNPANFKKFFTVPYWTLLTGGFAPYHRPMIPVMIMTVSQFFGKHPFGYHLLNVLLYGLTSGVFFLFLKQIVHSRFILFTAAAVFIFHPVHAEAVSWGSARPVLFSGLCFISCLYFSARLAFKPNVILFLGLLATYALGLLSYHSVIGVLPAAVFMDWILKLPKNPTLKKTEYAAYLLMTSGFIFFCLTLFKQMGETDLRPFYSESTAQLIYQGVPFENFLAFLNTVTRYAEILLMPANLIPDAYFAASQFSLSAVLSFVFFLGLSAALCFNADYRQQVLFAVLWMGCGILTVSNIVPQGGLFSDRYLYIASMGFALWAACVMDALFKTADQRFPGNQKRLLAGLALVLGLFALTAVTYSFTWQNEMKFWYEASRLSPLKARTHQKFGAVLEAAGFPKEAADEYRKTLALDPDGFILTYKKLADLLRKSGEAKEADELERIFAEKLKAAAEKQSTGREPALTVSR